MDGICCVIDDSTQAGILLQSVDFCPCMEKRCFAHLYPVALLNANEISASTQHLCSFADTVISGYTGLVTTEYLTFADLEIAEYLTLASAAFYGQHDRTATPTRQLIKTILHGFNS